MVTITEMRSDSQGQSMKSAFLPNLMMPSIAGILDHYRHSFETKVMLRGPSGGCGGNSKFTRSRSTAKGRR